MGVSGNSIALKSFQGYMVNDGLLAKVVEAIKAGEKEARNSGTIQSFEAFYKGFRQNISIGRIYVIPPSVTGKSGAEFPTSLLYGCLVRTYGGEEMSDLISHKIGDSEFDEYSQADYDSIKEELFGVGDGKFAALIIFAPHWVNQREYIGFHFTKDDNQLANLVRHLIFSAYFDPRLSSAFDAIMTDVDTTQWSVDNITPKLNFPAIAENPLKEYPLLTKQSSLKKTILLTRKTADEVTKQELDPQEMNVFESLDQALRNSMLPETEGVEDASEGKAPTKNVQVPRISSEQKTAQEECPKCEGDGCRYCDDKGYVVKKAGPADKTDEISGNPKDMSLFADPSSRPQAVTSVPRPGTPVKPMPTTAEYQPKTGQPCSCKPGVQRDNCPQCEGTGMRIDFAKIREKNKSGAAVHETPFTNVGPGTEAAEKGNQEKEGYTSEKDMPVVELTSAPIGIALDETGVPRRPEEERKQAKRMEFTPKADVGRLHAQETDSLSASASAAWEAARVGDKKGLEKHKDHMMEYAASMSQDNQAHHATFDHQAEIDAGKWGPNPMSMSSSLKKQKSKKAAWWAGSMKKLAQQLDDFTTAYVTAALWSSNDNSDPSGGEPLDRNYDIRDIAPETLNKMSQDCQAFQQKAEALLNEAYQRPGYDGHGEWSSEEQAGHDFWLTRNGHGAGFWDRQALDGGGLGDKLTEVAKSFGEDDLYVGDDNLIHSEYEHYNKQGGKFASIKKSAASEIVAGLIAGGPTRESYDARSQKSKTAAQKREEEMQRKYGSQRAKFADIPMTEDDIFDNMEEFGPAPVVPLPGEDAPEGSEKPEWEKPWESDTPEDDKSVSDSEAGNQESDFENEKTKEDEDKGGGGAKSEWSKNREKGKSEKKEESGSEEKSDDAESKQAAVDSEGYEVDAQGLKESLLADGSAEECPKCGAVSAYSWDDVNYCDNCSEPFGTDLPEEDRIYHIGAASSFEWECGKCRTSWTPADSPLTAEVYTHRDPRENDFDIESSLDEMDTLMASEEKTAAPDGFYQVEGDCECTDPGCPQHEGVAQCLVPASCILRRVDMDDVTGTAFCDGCAEDAMASGVFTYAEDEEPELGDEEMNYFASEEKTAGAPYSATNPPPIDAENPPDDWVDCGSCGGTHPPDFYGDCRDDYNRWPSGYTTGEKPIDQSDVRDLSLHHMTKPMMGSEKTADVADNEVSEGSDSGDGGAGEGDNLSPTVQRHEQYNAKQADTADNPANEAGGAGAMEVKTDHEKAKTADDVSGDISEAKSKTVSPDTVDKDISQPTKSVPEAAKVADTVDNPSNEKGGADPMVPKTNVEKSKTAEAIDGDLAQARKAVDADKKDLTSDSASTDTVNPAHFAASVKAAPQTETGEFPYVEALSGMGWSDEGDPGTFMGPETGNRVVVHTSPNGWEIYADGELVDSGTSTDELVNQLELASTWTLAEKQGCAAYGDEEDEERPIDLGIGDLADFVVEKETEGDAN